MMDRPSSSTNPLFLEQDGDMTNFVTKSQLFGAHRALHQEQLALGDRIDNLATDVRKSEQRTRDYFDTSMSSLKEDIRTMMVNRSSTTSSSSRRSRSSRHSDDTISGSSTPTSNTLRRAARQDRQANRNPLHDNPTQEQFNEQAHRHR